MSVSVDSIRERLAYLVEEVNAELDAGRRVHLRAEIAECRRRLAVQVETASHSTPVQREQAATR